MAFVGLTVVKTSSNVIAGENWIPSAFGARVLPNVFDNGRNTVFIKADNPQIEEEDKDLANIVTKKENWERKFPAKKIVAMSIVTGDGGRYGSPIVYGLLIQYEQR
ncbi:MAG: hypothetical protein NTY93_01555 [Candidatus Kaiserbacteria bacterium]|nr:hypothetical protein [Candidatus Kaiserbacteria bacterium]